MGYYDTMVTVGWGLALARATLTTLLVSVLALLVGALIGPLVAWAKLGPVRWLTLLADVYTTVIRGVPDLLVIYLFYFGGSAALGSVAGLFGAQGFVEMPALAAGALGIGVISGAYQAEVYRAGYLAIARGEIEAARAIGMRPALLLRRIIVPQTLRFAIPGLGNCWQLILKESALISVIGLVELLRQAQVGAGATLQPFHFYTTAAALYLLLTALSGVGFDRAEARAVRGLRRG